MDASVIQSKKFKDLYIVSTTDFFYPNVEDPYLQGRIAGCNVLSDMYAMGVFDIDNVLMILAVSSEMEISDREIATKLMMKGFDDLCKEADTQVSGGQTISNPWPIIGGVAKTVCKMADIIMPTGAQIGDVIVLTKPLGTQVAVNVKQWMSMDEKVWEKNTQNKISKQDGDEAYFHACEIMSRLNRNASRLMHKYHAHAATDVTGFGILGHARNLASNQKEKVEFRIHTLPCIKNMPLIATTFGFKLLLGLSAETSGGLFICLGKDQAVAFAKELLEEYGESSWIIGHVVASEERTANLDSNLKIIEV